MNKIPKKYERYITKKDGEKYYRVHYHGNNTSVNSLEKAIQKVDEFKRLGIEKLNWKDGNITIQSGMEEWLSVNENNIRETSFKRKQDTATNQIYPNIGFLLIKNLNKQTLNSFLVKLRNGNNVKNYEYSESTIKKAYLGLKEFYEKNDYIRFLDSNPFSDNIKFSNTKIMKESAFSIEDVKKIIDVVGLNEQNSFEKVYNWIAPFVVLILNTGLRVGEMSALTWDDYFEDKEGNKYLNVSKTAEFIKQNKTDKKETLVIGSTKTGAERVLPLNQHAILALEYFRTINGDKKYIVSNKYGNVIRPSVLRRTFSKILAAAEIDNPKNNNKRYKFNLHSLRHTYATILINEGNVNPAHAQQLLGHSNVATTTEYYVKSAPEKYLDDVVKLDYLFYY